MLWPALPASPPFGTSDSQKPCTLSLQSHSPILLSARRSHPDRLLPSVPPGPLPILPPNLPLKHNRCRFFQASVPTHFSLPRPWVLTGPSSRIWVLLSSFLPTQVPPPSSPTRSGLRPSVPGSSLGAHIPHQVPAPTGTPVPALRPPASSLTEPRHPRHTHVPLSSPPYLQIHLPGVSPSVPHSPSSPSLPSRPTNG